MPKNRGRSRRDKSPKVRENSNGKHKARVKSSSRPKTKRSTRVISRQASTSAGRHNSQVKCDVKNYEQHEYLQFTLRITEDIIKNDLYDNDQMKKVLASHFEANKGRLDADKMIAALYELCLELNIPVTENLDPNSTTISQDIPTQTAKNIISSAHDTPKTNLSPPCICPDRKLSNTTDPCLCMTERKPHNPCLLHPSICVMQLTGTESLEIKILKSPDGSLASKKENSQSTISAEKYSEIRILHPVNKSESQSRVSIDTRGSDRILCDCESESCIRETCDGVEVQEISHPIETFLLDNTSEASEISEKSITSSKSSPEEEDKIELLQSIEHIEKTSEILVEDDNKSEENEKEDMEEMEEMEDEVVEVQREVVKQDFTRDCKLTQLVLEYDKKMAHPKNIHQLDIPYYMTKIEPTKVDTLDLNIQTSVEKTCHCMQEFDNQRKKLSVSRGTQSIPQCNNNYFQRVILPPKQQQKTVPNYGQSSNDFIILEGAVFIPKFINKGAEVSFNHISNRHQCDCGKISISKSECGKPRTNNKNDSSYPVHTMFSNVKAPSYTSSYVQKSSCRDQANQNFDMLQHERFACERCEPCRTSSFYNKSAHYSCHYQECDITPQREIPMYNNINCKTTQNSCCMKYENLLLGNQYSRYSVNNNNISHFYPTIATQVSSMDILSTKPEKIERQDINTKESVVLSDKLNFFQEKTISTVSDLSEIKMAESKPTGPDFQLDVLEKLKEIPKVVESSESVDKIIQSLRKDLNKYRESDNVNSGLLRSPQETITRDRGVSISEEVQMIKDYSILKKASVIDRS